MKLTQEDIDAIADAVAAKLIATWASGPPPAAKVVLDFDRNKYRSALQQFRRGDRKSLREFLTGRDLTPLRDMKK